MEHEELLAEEEVGGGGGVWREGTAPVTAPVRGTSGSAPMTGISHSGPSKCSYKETLLVPILVYIV